jgi:hypothetical protein|nr:MAG TPA_asm: hypothetical protein [Caudoviricetes sp.]
MIYEKGLIKAMKDEYKAGGYSVADDGNGILWIVADMWFAGIRKGKVSNDVKSVIVLHFGQMPEGHSAMYVSKDKDPNTEIIDTVLSVPQMLAEAEDQGVFRLTLLRIGNRVVLQNDDLIIRTATEDALLPMAYGYTTWLRSGYLVQDDGESFVGAMSCHGVEGEIGKIELLEQVDWR